MIIEAQVLINAPRAAVWTAITDIANAGNIIRGIEKIEILEHPGPGITGLRWRETRLLFGKPAAVEKWVTDIVENESYQTRAEDGGFVFVTTRRLSESGGGMILSESHESIPQTVAARIQAIPMSLFFRGVVKKYLLQDLHDIRTAAEGQ